MRDTKRSRALFLLEVIVMSSREVGFNYTTISGGVGTAVVVDRNTTLHSVTFQGTYVGTLNLHDASATDGTTSTSQILSFGLPATTTPFTVNVNANLRNGLVYQATGTPVALLKWD